MAYLSKQTILSAYKFLSTLSPDPTKQGAIQKVSALRYFLALDMFYKKHDRPCDTRDKNDSKEFIENVGTVVSIKDDCYTSSFFTELAFNKDYNVGSNFFSVNVVKLSLDNGGTVLDFPRRGGTPLMKVQSGKLIYEPSYLENVNSFIPNDEHKVALVLWLLRGVNIDSGDAVDSVYDALANMLREDVINIFKINRDDFERIAYNLLFDRTDEPAILSQDDILKCFEPVHKEGDVSFDSASILQQNQIIFYGAPGTGKSHRIDFRLKQMKVPSTKVFRTTFHPDTDYSSFVGCYKPTSYSGGSSDVAPTGKITYSFVPQVFTKAYVEAWKHQEENVFLIIEEINRGNCAQIFGDLFQLLDRDEKGISKYPIKADSDMENFLLRSDQLGAGNEGILYGDLKLPGNLFIWATMNTSDQSLFPMDSAFKRRWEQEYVPISYSDASGFTLNIAGENLNWGTVLFALNDYIKEATHSANKLIGNRFIQPRVGNVISYKMFRDKVLFYLFNDVFKDDDTFASQFYLNKPGYLFFEDLCEKDDPQIALTFIKGLLNASSTETDDSSSTETEEN